MAFRLKPKDDKIYRLFIENTEAIRKAAEVLQTAMQDPENLQQHVQRVDELEQEADMATAKIVEQLNKSFITPLDREDIYHIAQKLDDVIDSIQGTVERMYLYNAAPASPAALQLGELVVKAAKQISKVFDELSEMKKNKEKMTERCARISQLEGEGDHLYRQEVAKLFRECPNPVELIKWKEILFHLEETLDVCEDLANMLKGVVMKYA
ncbi:MAG TPA: DUF47 family protein [Patescibacteria group bacterium]|nr:DUF47 family protein [Patescibacteria group bacterium]